MSTKTYYLNANNTVQVVDLDFPAVLVAINNPTASPIYMTIGAPNVPNAINADAIIPAAFSRTIAVKGAGRGFCLALGNPSLVTIAGQNLLSGLEAQAEIIFLSAGEIVPTFGANNFLSLSMSDLTGGYVNYVHPGSTSSVFDLTPWGGAIVSVIPAALSGQGVVSVQASADGLTWNNILNLAFWRSTPLTINVARTVKYFRLVFNSTAIPGEANIAGVYSVRASMAEIIQTTYAAGNGEINYGLSVAPLNTQTIYFCTVGLRSVSIKLEKTSGASSGVEMVWYTSGSLANFSMVAYREQGVTGLQSSIFRSLGMLDSFLRIDILEISNTGTWGGSIRLSIKAEPDLTGVLQAMYAALGDQGQPVNVGQSIYHQLARMYTLENTQLPAINALITATNTLLNQFQTDRQAYTEFFFYPLTVTTSGVYVSTPAILGPYANRYVVSAQLNYRTTGKRYAPGTIFYGFGVAGGINQYIYRGGENLEKTQDNLPPLSYNAGAMGAGVRINPAWDRIWLYADSPMAVDIIMGIR